MGGHNSVLLQPDSFACFDNWRRSQCHGTQQWYYAKIVLRVFVLVAKTNKRLKLFQYLWQCSSFFHSVLKLDDFGHGHFFLLVDGIRIIHASNTGMDNQDNQNMLSIHLNLQAGARVQVENYNANYVYGRYMDAPWGNGILTQSFFSGTMLYPLY